MMSFVDTEVALSREMIRGPDYVYQGISGKAVMSRGHSGQSGFACDREGFQEIAKRLCQQSFVYLTFSER